MSEDPEKATARGSHRLGIPRHFLGVSTRVYEQLKQDM